MQESYSRRLGVSSMLLPLLGSILARCSPSIGMPLRPSEESHSYQSSPFLIAWFVALMQHLVSDDLDFFVEEIRIQNPHE
jgi:hypothetical protein